MPNPRAQKPLSYEQIIKDAKSLGVPAQALLDALAGGVKGSVSATVGAPADIYNLINQASFRGQLPTAPYGSEDISKMLPDVVPTEDKSRKHSAEYGEFAGSFIPTPMTGQALKGAVKLGAKGAKALGEEAGRRAVMGESFTPFVNTAIPQTNVIKPKGGNWINGNVEKSLDSLLTKGIISNQEIPFGPDFDVAIRKRIEDLKQAASQPDYKGGAGRVAERLEEELKNPRSNEVALNKWVQNNLTNYVKKEMATPEDPVRKLAEQGVTHFPIAEDPNYWARKGESSRKEAGGNQMALSDLGKQWENRSDAAINAETALQHQDMMHLAPGLYSSAEDWIKKLPPDTKLYNTRGSNFNPRDLGFDHILDVLKEDVASGRLRPESLKNVSMEQAVRRAYEYDQELAKKMEDAKAKRLEGMTVHKEYPEGYKWVQLDKPGQFAAESNAMGHSVRGYEPPKGHPDWIPESGDSGSEYYGHGGWEGIKSGRAKIYSLVDPKGNPHTTVEVASGKHPIGYSFKGGNTEFPEKFNYNLDFSESYPRLTPEQNQSILNRAKEIFSANPSLERMNAFQQASDEILGSLPADITQIKGKGNGKPVESYIPYVQDFVKSGNWGDVGDIKNTGLKPIQNVPEKARFEEVGMKLPKYVTDAEHEGLIDEYMKLTNPPMDLNFMNKEYGFSFPVEGMKQGGAVHISDNPDTMYMELMDRKFAGGGAIAKLARALAKKPEEIKAIAERMAPQVIGEEFIRGKQGTQSIAGKTQKQFAREKELEHDIRPTKELPEVKPVDLAEHKGKVMIGIAGDPSIAHHEVHAVAGSPLSSPSPQHGGPFYGRGNEPFWASGLGAANRVQNLAREASGQYGNADVLGNYMMMPEGLNYAQHFADANLSAINPSKMTKAQIEGFNDLLRKGSNKSGPRENFPGIEDQGSAYLWMSQDPELRKYFNALMQQPTVTEKFGLPSGKDVAHAITEPDLRNVETGVTGKSLGLLRPEVTNLERSMHPTYSHDIPGEFLGSTSHPIPYELSFPDMMQAIRNNPSQAPQEFGSLKMVGPRQIIDQQLIDEIGEYQRRMKELTGKKKGGAIKKAKGGEISEDDIQMEVRPL